jgi:hypothetical protein
MFNPDLLLIVLPLFSLVLGAAVGGWLVHRMHER